MNVRVLSIAEVEAAETALHYEKQQPALGDQFLTEFEHAAGSDSSQRQTSCSA